MPVTHSSWQTGAYLDEPVVFAIWTVFVVLIGAVLGSFINVVAARLPEGRSVVTPRSQCPGCGHLIAWYDNIPVLSYLLLRARCRHCETGISWAYPAVEALAAVLACALWLTHGPSPALFVDALVVGLLLTLGLIDARTYLLPERLTIPLIVFALLGRFGLPLLAGADLDTAWRSLGEGAAGAGLGALLLGAVAWIGTRWARRSGRIGPDEDAMGFGDVVLIAGIGAQVGVVPVLPVIFLASIQGGVIGGLLIYLSPEEPPAAEDQTADSPPNEPGERSEVEAQADDQSDDDWQPPRHAVPFGPFLALGAIEWILFDQTLSAWLSHYFPFF